MKAEEKIKIVTIFMAIGIFISAYFIALNQSYDDHIKVNNLLPLKAVIVDEINITSPNQDFVKIATNMLEQAGYSVDYYSNEKVTVKFYKDLPMHDYKLIILRVHSSLMQTNTGLRGRPLSFFTSERYDNVKHFHSQMANQLSIVYFYPGGDKGDKYFGIKPDFVTSMNGRFKDAAIIAMGCDSLNDTLMANAFIEKGAAVYIGWKIPITIEESDAATIHLLRHFLIEKMTLNESLKQTFKDARISDNSNQLIYYPEDYS